MSFLTDFPMLVPIVLLVLVLFILLLILKKCRSQLILVLFADLTLW